MLSKNIEGIIGLIEMFEQGKGRPKWRHFIAVMDDRTCPICRKYHCKVYSYDEGPEPPLHPNCRCYYEPLWELPSPFENKLYRIIKLE
ncbi:MAG: minor capsid protein [Candidatus Bathyarchaeia archaeon]